MIVLLGYSTSSLADNSPINSSTGGVTEDSILVSYDDLRKANAKLVELEYEKDINKNLKDIIKNDSVAIDGLRTEVDRVTRESREQIRKSKRERNLVGGLGIVSVILLILTNL